MTGIQAYVYAKTSGMLASSFVGTRLNRLFEANSLSDLWALCFDTEVPVVPEVILAKSVEKEAEKRFVGDYIALLKMYKKPPALLVELLRSFDYDNLKEIGAELCFNTGIEPDIVDIGNYSMLYYKAGKDIGRMVRESPVSWYTVPTPATQMDADTKLDKQYIVGLWKSVKKLPAHERRTIENLIREEIVMHNIAWAIRLRVYFDFSKDDVIPLLAYSGAEPDMKDELARDAIKILDYPIDGYEAWAQWKYAELLNPHEEGVYWSIDPRWVQHAAKLRAYKSALALFHRHPFSISVMVSFFKIKQYELDCVRTAAEALRLNAEKTAVREFAGIEE
jgi:vacuolar-type H+-ATPase subunit C/Vma6